MLTYRDDEGVYVDLGASWIHGYKGTKCDIAVESLLLLCRNSAVFVIFLVVAKYVYFTYLFFFVWQATLSLLLLRVLECS